MPYQRLIGPSDGQKDGWTQTDSFISARYAETRTCKLQHFDWSSLKRLRMAASDWLAGLRSSFTIKAKRKEKHPEI